jgi:hypothetical protein
MPAFVEIALFHAEFADFARMQALHLRHVLRQLVGMADARKVELQQLLHRVTDDVAKPLVHALEAAGARIGEVDPHGGLVKQAQKALLTRTQSRLRVAHLHMLAPQQNDQYRQNQRKHDHENAAQQIAERTTGQRQEQAGQQARAITLQNGAQAAAMAMTGNCRGRRIHKPQKLRYLEQKREEFSERGTKKSPG